eukprot:5139605-Prymnesium_polylepis.2
MPPAAESKYSSRPPYQRTPWHVVPPSDSLAHSPRCASSREYTRTSLVRFMRWCITHSRRSSKETPLTCSTRASPGCVTTLCQRTTSELDAHSWPPAADGTARSASTWPLAVSVACRVPLSSTVLSWRYAVGVAHAPSSLAGVAEIRRSASPSGRPLAFRTGAAREDCEPTRRAPARRPSDSELTTP